VKVSKVAAHKSTKLSSLKPGSRESVWVCFHGTRAQKAIARMVRKKETYVIKEGETLVGDTQKREEPT